jgi:hypothetical protein
MVREIRSCIFETIDDCIRLVKLEVYGTFRYKLREYSNRWRSKELQNSSLWMLLEAPKSLILIYYTI